MKKIILLVAIVLVQLSCKQTVENKSTETPKVTKAEETVTPNRLQNVPEDIVKVFEAHGGISTFDQMNTLVFELQNPEGNEKHTTDLKSRFAKIETDKFALGFDGKEAWLAQDSLYFKSDPRFYHNLMFYFYAMPFVLADDGIIYDKVEALTVDDKSYPGYKISYGADVGDSPKDNYFLYYDADTHQMKYLGYTVTYFSKESSEKISLIDYRDWTNVDGLVLPQTLVWMNYKEGVVGAPKSERKFVNASLSNDKLPVTFFQNPKNQ